MPVSPHSAAILEAIAQIPPGRVMSYGDVAEYAGVSSARMVGRILAMDAAYADADADADADAADADAGDAAGADAGSGGCGSDELPWHRVLRADGTPAPHLRERQLQLLRSEGVPMRGERVDMRAARWDGAPVD